ALGGRDVRPAGGEPGELPIELIALGGDADDGIDEALVAREVGTVEQRTDRIEAEVAAVVVEVVPGMSVVYGAADDRRRSDAAVEAHGEAALVRIVPGLEVGVVVILVLVVRGDIDAEALVGGAVLAGAAGVTAALGPGVAVGAALQFVHALLDDVLRQVVVLDSGLAPARRAGAVAVRASRRRPADVVEEGLHLPLKRARGRRLRTLRKGERQRGRRAGRAEFDDAADERVGWEQGARCHGRGWTVMVLDGLCHGCCVSPRGLMTGRRVPRRPRAVE